MRGGTCGSVKKTTKCFFSLEVWEKSPIFNPHPTGNFPINTRVRIHQYSYRTWRFKRNANTRSISGGVSPQPLFLCGWYIFDLVIK